MRGEETDSVCTVFYLWVGVLGFSMVLEARRFLLLRILLAVNYEGRNVLTRTSWFWTRSYLLNQILLLMCL